MELQRHAILAASLATVLLAPAAAQGKLGRYLASLPHQSISAAERADLIAIRQEEKLARDVYQVLGRFWSLTVFDNIQQSEESHMDLVKRMLDKYQIPDPLVSNAWGIYQDPAFSQLFVQLIQFGVQSPLHALAVGAFVEDLDIVDLGRAIQRTDNRDIGTVYQNLVRGSRNHLRSFYGLIVRYGIVYPGFVLTSAQVQAIVTSPRETRPVDENGKPL